MVEFESYIDSLLWDFYLVEKYNVASSELANFCIIAYVKLLAVLL